MRVCLRALLRLRARLRARVPSYSAYIDNCIRRPNGRLIVIPEHKLSCHVLRELKLSADDPGMMNPVVALEVFGDAFLRDILAHNPRFLKELAFELKILEIAAKDRPSVFREQARKADDEFCMIALDIPGSFVHAIGVGKGRHVAQNEIPTMCAMTCFLYPAQDICLDKLVLFPDKSIALHISLRPR